MNTINRYILLLLTSTTFLNAQSDTLSVGNVVSAPGSTIELPVNFIFGTQEDIQGIDIELSLDLDIFSPGSIDIDCADCLLSGAGYEIAYNVSDDCIDTSNGCIKVAIYAATANLFSGSGGLLFRLPLGISSDEQYLNNSYSIFVSMAMSNDVAPEIINHGSVSIYLDSSCHINQDNDGAQSCNYNANYSQICGGSIPDCSNLCPSDSEYGDFSCCIYEQVYYQDSDGDGLGNQEISVSECADPPGFVINGDDPDDNCYSNDFDCLGICNGVAEIDCSGDCDGGAVLICDSLVCCGGDTGIDCFNEEDCECEDGSVRDCNGLCESDGEAYGAVNDECGVCGGDSYIGENGLFPNGTCDCDGSFIDCAGDCGGSAVNDECGVCEGLNACHDCAGVPYGLAEPDSCGICSGGTTGHDADSDKDCAGDCFGEAIVDECGVCSGGTTGHDADSDKDCAGDCFGEAIIDECGVCNGDGFIDICADYTIEATFGGCQNMDCAGTCDPETPVGADDLNINGAEFGAFLDLCGVCSGGDVSGHAENQDMDCRGNIGDEDEDGLVDSCFGNYFIDPCGSCTDDVLDCGTRIFFEDEQCQYQGTKLIPLYAEDLVNLESLDLIFDYYVDGEASLDQAINVLDDLEIDGTSIDSSEGRSLALVGTKLSEYYSLIATENDLEISLSIYLDSTLLPQGTTDDDIPEYAVDISSKEPILYIPVRGLGSVENRGVGDVTFLEIKEVFVNEVPVTIPDPQSENSFNGTVELTDYYVPNLEETNVYQTFRFRNSALEEALDSFDEIGVFDKDGIIGNEDSDRGPVLVGSVVWNPEVSDSLEFRAIGSSCNDSSCSPGYVEGNLIYINRYDATNNTETYLTPDYLYCGDNESDGDCEFPSEGTINGLSLETYFNFVNESFDVDQTLFTITGLSNGYFPSEDIVETSQKYTVNIDLNEHLTWLSNGDEIAIYDMFGYTPFMSDCDDLDNRGQVIAGYSGFLNLEGQNQISIDIFGTECEDGGLIPGFEDRHPLRTVVWDADKFEYTYSEFQFETSSEHGGIPTSPSNNNFFDAGREVFTISNSSPDDQPITSYGYFGVPKLIYPDPITGSDFDMRFAFSNDLGSDSIDLESGDEIAIYDDDGIMLCDTTATLVTGPILLGAGTYNRSLGLNIDIPRAIDYCSENGFSYPGYISNNQVNIRIWDKSEDIEISVLNNFIFDGIDKDISSLDIESLSLDDNTLPSTTGISKIYPNPFNPTTNIEFSIPLYQHVKISVYDVSGNQVSVLNEEFFQAGTHNLTWDAKRFASGIYFIRFESEGFLGTDKVMLIK